MREIQDSYEKQIRAMYAEVMALKSDAAKLRGLDILYRVTANELVAERAAGASFEKIMEETFGKDTVNQAVEERDVYSNMDLLTALLSDDLKEEAPKVFPEVGTLFELQERDKDDISLD